MSGRTWLRLAILLPLYLLRYAFNSSHDYDYTPPAFNYTPPSFDYTPPVLPSVPDPKVEPPVATDTLQLEDGSAPDLATAKGDFEPVVASIGAFDPVGAPVPHVMLGDSAAIGVTMADPSVAIGKRWLATWNLTPAQAVAIATANLRQDQVAFEQVEPGLWSTPDSDTIGASRILLLDEIKKLHLAGGPVAMIPNRGRLLLAGANDAKGLAAMATRAGELATGSHVIHTIPLCLSGTVWKDCVPHLNADIAQQFSDLASNGHVAVYDAVSDAYQKELGDDIFVAHLMAVEKPDGGGVTYATWTKTVPSMLPKADKVAFVVLEGPEGAEKGRMLGVAPWDRVMAVCGAHLKETGKLPRYWATGDWFPSDADLKKLALTDKP